MSRELRRLPLRSAYTNEPPSGAAASTRPTTLSATSAGTLNAIGGPDDTAGDGGGSRRPIAHPSANTAAAAATAIAARDQDRAGQAAVRSPAACVIARANSPALWNRSAGSF